VCSEWIEWKRSWPISRNSSGITVILFGFLIFYICAKCHANLIVTDLITVEILGADTNCKTVHFVIFSIPPPFHLNIDSSVPLQSAIDLCSQIEYLLKTALVGWWFRGHGIISQAATSLNERLDGRPNGVRENIGNAQVSGQCRCRHANPVLKTGLVNICVGSLGWDRG
jgi:hypothetical protein